MSARVSARVSDYAEAVFEDLRKEGIELAPRDVIRINAICAMVEDPESRLALARGVPVAVGGSTLWPLTLAAADWLDRVGYRLGYRGVSQQTWTLAYAMAHGYEPMPECIREARRAVKKWARGLRCRHAALVEAVSQIIEQDEDLGADPPTLKGGTLGDLSAMLAAMTKTSPEVWERHVTLPYARGVIQAIVAQDAADSKALIKDRRLRYERALLMLIKRVREANRGA